VNATTLRYRQAEPADIPAMSAIRLAVRENRLSSPDRITHGMYLDYLSRLGRGWVCEADGEIVGFAFADLQDGSVWALFMHRHYEGLGIGRTLLGMAADWLFGAGHDTVRLQTAGGTRADRFYQACGWLRSVPPSGDDVCYTLHRPVTTP
jgi:GNAT superfamily N-acetyltransferase